MTPVTSSEDVWGGDGTGRPARSRCHATTLVDDDDHAGRVVHQRDRVFNRAGRQKRIREHRDGESVNVRAHGRLLLGSGRRGRPGGRAATAPKERTRRLCRRPRPELDPYPDGRKTSRPPASVKSLISSRRSAGATARPRPPVPSTLSVLRTGELRPGRDLVARISLAVRLPVSTPPRRNTVTAICMNARSHPA